MVEQILTDQGVNFESQLFKHLCILLGTNKLHTSTYHAAGNGITERVNRTVKPNLAKFVNDDHDDWDMFLQLSISAYNNTYHSSIGMTPYEAVFGRKSVFVADVIMNNQLPSNTKLKDIADFTFALRRSADHVSRIIRENTLVAQAKQKLNYDRFVKEKAEFQVGDVVKINNCRRHVGLSKAFEPKFIGPFTITKKLGDLNYQLEAPNIKSEIFHYNRLLPYYTRKQFACEPEPFVVSQPGSQSVESVFRQNDVEVLPDYFLHTIMHDYYWVKPKKKTLAVLTPSVQTNLQSVIDSVACGEAVISLSPALSDMLYRTSPLRELESLRFVDANASFEADEPEHLDVPSTASVMPEQLASVDGVRVNDKDKPVIACPGCSRFFEASFGIKIHAKACKGPTNTLI